MSDGKLVNGLQSRLQDFPEGLLVAALYAATCWAARQVSLDQFFLPAGIRVAALLICRREMWPYLLLGEYAYFAHLRIPLIDRHGLEWVVVSSAYQFPIVALVVFLHRRSASKETGTWLLTVSAAAAVLIGVGTLLIAYALRPTAPSGGFITIAFRNTLGDYIAILTVAPLAMVWTRRHDIDWPSLLSSRCIYAGLSLLVCGVVSILIPHDSPAEKATIQLLMAVPVIALTCLQGWWGAAIGMPLMNIFIRIGTPVTGLPESFDLDSFKVQLLTAVSGSALLAVGSRITHHYHQYTVQAKGRRQAISNARVSHIVGEGDLRNHVASLRSISDGLEVSLSSTVDWLRVRGYHDMASSLLSIATVHSRKFREQTSLVYPTTMEHVGLYLSLQVGGIGEIWEQTERIVQPHLTGDPCRLSLDLQLTAYRALTEAVSLLLEHEHGQLKIRARCGRIGSTHGIVVTVGSVDARHRFSRSTATMAIGRLSGRTQAWGGTVQCRRNRIRMSFGEPPTC
ncbi:MASE1 domain-containing protein [Stenotrophomonas sp.]|uniref:MASE1 domain-containing protein n=1 Tax=Stenotrophomonas sp. TaxID=69392 RepID=UPI002899FC0E|nr:MASE1 domain-containing protein [Stenotrophomonas sp.]